MPGTTTIANYSFTDSDGWANIQLFIAFGSGVGAEPGTYANFGF